MRRLLPSLLLLWSPMISLAEAPFASSVEDDRHQAISQAMQTCLLQALREADEQDTVRDLRQRCGVDLISGRQRNEDALRQRLALEQATGHNPFAMTPHRRNYIMPASWWSNPRWNNPSKHDGDLDDMEVKFQLSIKANLFNWREYSAWFAYTQVSFLQAFNSDASRPIRESNYEPELFLTRPVDWQLGPLDSELIAFGYVHQSNGQDMPTSRSWDRLFLTYVARMDQYYLGLRTWWRFPEDEKSDPLDEKGDDNPDIEKYLGHFELTVARPFGNHVAEVMLRNNLRRGENRGALQLEYTFPISRRFKGIVQAFTGYGDSLINYDDYQNRFSLGVLLTDTL